MAAVCRITADLFERASGLPALLERAGACVDVRPLHVGDYDLGSGVLVERKAVADLHGSLIGGRFWGQVGRLRSAARVPCLLVEGPHLRGPVATAAVRAALLAVSDLGCVVVRSTSRSDSAEWLVSLARRGCTQAPSRLRPRYAQRAQPAAADVPQAMLAAVPGLSVVTARALLTAFGSVQAVLTASEDELRTVRGMGPTRVRALRRAVS
jgi:ERCC4-type nuclease